MPFLSPGDLPDQGIEPRSSAWAGGFLTTEPPGKPSGSNAGSPDPGTTSPETSHRLRKPSSVNCLTVYGRCSTFPSRPVETTWELAKLVTKLFCLATCFLSISGLACPNLLPHLKEPRPSPMLSGTSPCFTFFITIIKKPQVILHAHFFIACFPN